MLEISFSTPQWLLDFYHVITVLSAITNSLAIYLIVFKSGHIDSFKHFLLWFTICCLLSDFFMFFLMQPIPLLPIWGGYINGPFWTVFRVSCHRASMISGFMIGQQFAALTLCFVRKWQAISKIDSTSQVSNAKVVAVIVLTQFLIVIWLMLYCLTGIDRADALEMIKANYPTLLERFLELDDFQLYTANPITICFLVFAAASAAVFITIIAVSTLQMLKLLRNLEMHVSSAHVKRHRSAVSSLVAQFLTSSVAVVPPVACGVLLRFEFDHIQDPPSIISPRTTKMTETETIVNPPQAVFDQIVKLTGETEDWGFQPNDYNFWSQNFDKFWLVTVVEKGSQNLVASVSLARWDGADGPLFSVGLFYCAVKYRGSGYGKPIFKQVMDIVGQHNATLTGVVNMSDKYAKDFGFDKMPSFWHLFSSIKMDDIVIPEQFSEKFVSKVWTDVDYEALTAYDRTICTRDRKKLMTSWFELKDTFTRVVLDVTGHHIVGYGTIRIVSKKRLSAAPVYADSLEAAEVLLADLLKNIENWRQYASIGFLYPEVNGDALRLVAKFAKSKELVSTGRFIRSQFTKTFIASPDEKVYSMSDCAHQFV
ncbi:unnamed protein product [Caenorhabditis sp. 36 PRJEB53466]|nr:unnamed protein product [Caenorhabditis sp. 36 PRJEB53466]